MIIKEEYIIKAFHLKSRKILFNSLFTQNGHFNFYQVEDDKKMNLFTRTKDKDENGKDCIIETLKIILSPDCIEYIELEEVEKIPEEMLSILNIVEDKK